MRWFDWHVTCFATGYNPSAWPANGRSSREHKTGQENVMLVRLWIFAAVVLLSCTGARADTLDEIKKRGEMVIGMEAAYVPYESIKDGQIVGFDCEIGQRFADKLGVKVKFVDTEWSGIIPALYTKTFDIILL